MCRILVVQENAKSTESVRKAVEAAGHKVTMFAHNKDELLECISNGEYDCIIADPLLPDMEPNEIASIIEKSTEHKVIYITSVPKKYFNGAFKGTDISDRFMRRPFLISNLIKALEGMLKGIA